MRASHHATQNFLKPVMVRMVQVIGLGGGEQDAVGARPQQRAQEGLSPDREAFEQRLERGLQVAHRFRSGI